MPQIAPSSDRGAVELVFDATLYSSDVLERAAYRFSDRFAFELTSAGSGWLCRLHVSEGIDDEAIVHLAREFRKEALDQKLRVAIREQTAGTRDLILARAFSRTGLTPES